MAYYSELDFTLDNNKKRINIDLPVRLIEELDKIIYIRDISSRKQLIELLVIKFVLNKEDDLKKL